MATHDYVLDNATGANFRSDLNNALAAIVSNNSSSSEPSTKYAYQWWADTNDAVLKLRNSANDGWVELFKLDGTITLADGSNSAPSLAFSDDSNTGIFSSAADTLDITCGGTTRGSFSSSGLTVTGGIDGTGGNFVLGDSGSASDDRIKLGASGDLALYHDGSNSFIQDTGTGDLLVRTSKIKIQGSNGEDEIIATENGAVELYFDNAKKAETVTGGFTVTGTCTATAFAGDGSNLTGVSGTTINNNGNNRLITGSDTSGTLEGEARLTFDGDKLEAKNSNNAGIDFNLSNNTHPRIDFNTANVSSSGLIKSEESGSGAIMEFHNKNSSGSEQQVITLTIDRNLQINDGNLVVASGHGIDFSADGNATNMTGEVFDDYERGSWTPGSVTGTVAVASNGEYVKIGRFVQITVLLYNWSDTSSSNSVIITGVPFSCNSGGQYIGQVWLRRTTTGDKNYHCTIGNNAVDKVDIVHDSNGNSMGGNLIHSNFAHSTPYTNITIQYQSF